MPEATEKSGQADAHPGALVRDDLKSARSIISARPSCDERVAGSPDPVSRDVIETGYRRGFPRG